MTPHLEDTIVALASVPGPGARAIVRLSGPETARVVSGVFHPHSPLSASHPPYAEGHLRLPETSPFPAFVLFWKSPRSYTGQDVAEIHLVSSMPLVELLIGTILNLGARAANPGEFTLRAFLAGKRDLTQAEAVLGVIESTSRDELKQSLKQLAGGVSLPLHELREDLLNLLADVEAGLDFTEEHIEFVGKKEILLRVGKGLAQLMNMQKQLSERSLSGRPFRVALVGPPNAGKSSLFNLLAGIPVAIVSPIPGTTRDYLTRRIPLGQSNIELIDTAGWQEAADTVEEQAQRLGREQAKEADLLLWCIDSALPVPEKKSEIDGVPVQMVLTKCDRGSTSKDPLPVSMHNAFGVERLREHLRDRAQSMNRPALAPSLSRCKHHVEECLKHLRAGHAIVLFDDPSELLALELRLALEQLGEMVGAVYTEDLLGRIFSRFCIGK
jgi:tRNA modification GTPase